MAEASQEQSKTEKKNQEFEIELRKQVIKQNKILAIKNIEAKSLMAAEQNNKLTFQAKTWSGPSSKMLTSRRQPQT